MNIDQVTAPDGRQWPNGLTRWLFTDHGFRGVELTNSILSDIRVLLLVLLIVVMLK